MKKIFSLFALFVFMFIAFFENTMVSFAVVNMDMSMEMENKNMSGCCGEDEEKTIPCNHECCFQAADVGDAVVINTTRIETKKIKLKVKNFIDLFSVSLKSFENRSLVKIASPPDKHRYIKNYTYTNLVKIIKSNI